MSRERYGRPERWDSERFAMERERDRSRFSGEREHIEERESRSIRGGIPMRTRERSVDEIYERRGPRGFEEDEYRKRVYYDESPPRREPRRSRAESIAINIERERSPSPLRRPGKPVLIRRQSSLDTFDRKPFNPPWREREEYGPPARREDFRRERDEFRPPAYVPIPLPRTRALVPARRYEREVEVDEPEYYGDEAFRPYPERVREREIIRTRRHRSPSREAQSTRASTRASSVSSVSASSSSHASETTESEFPKRGKTRMPARLVSKKAIIELGYPFEEEGETIIIMKALGRENIDEVIRRSEEYKSETKTVYRLEGAEMSGGHSNAGEIIEERITQEVIEIPAPPPAIPPPPPEIIEEHVKTTTIERREISPARSHHHHHHHDHHDHHDSGALIVHSNDTRYETDFVETRKEKQVEVRSSSTPIGALALIPDRHGSRDTRAISAEIRALEMEKEALRAEKRRIRREGRESGELVLYEERVERIRDPEPSGGVRIERDRKGRMAISVPKKYR